METQSRNAGLTTLRLDTRLDLVDARRLYEWLGYTDVAPFTDGTYSEVWLSKGIERSESILGRILNDGHEPCSGRRQHTAKGCAGDLIGTGSQTTLEVQPEVRSCAMVADPLSCMASKSDPPIENQLSSKRAAGAPVHFALLVG